MIFKGHIFFYDERNPNFRWKPAKFLRLRMLSFEMGILANDTFSRRMSQNKLIM